MKKQLNPFYAIISLLAILFFASCQKEPIIEDEVLLTSKSEAVLSKILAVPVRSLDIDWENVNSINIRGTNVALPWVGGANTTIPSYVLEDMKKANGWDLYYNFPAWETSSANQNYLIFHNKFTGIVRVFTYNTIFTTDNSVGVFNVQIESNQPTSILSLVNPFVEVNAKTNPSSIHTNASDGEFSGFRTGWNSFDIPTSYDPNITSTSKVKMSIYSDQRTVSNLVLNGTFSSETKGELVTTSSSNSLSPIVNGVSKAVGKKAASWLEDKLEKGKLKDSSGLLNDIKNKVPDLVSKLVNRGIVGVFSSFIGGFGNTNRTSQSISLSTEGKLNVSGTILTGNPGVIDAFKLVSLPGTDYSDGGLLPARDESFGSWTISSTPVVKYQTFAKGRGQYLEQGYSLDASSFNIIINPAISSLLESVSVNSELWYYDKYQKGTIPDLEPSKNPNYYRLSGLNPSPANGTLIYNDAENSFLRSTTKIKILNEEWIEFRNPNQVTLDVNAYQPGFVVKVIVTMMPKSPYNTNPIVMSRSYIPRYIAR